MIIYIPTYDLGYDGDVSFGPYSTRTGALEELARRTCFTLYDGTTHITGKGWFVSVYILDNGYSHKFDYQKKEILEIWKKICEDSK